MKSPIFAIHFDLNPLLKDGAKNVFKSPGKKVDAIRQNVASLIRIIKLFLNSWMLSQQDTSPVEREPRQKYCHLEREIQYGEIFVL